MAKKKSVTETAKVDIIIPVYKPGKDFLHLIDVLESQTVPVGQIIIYNTEQKYWDTLVQSGAIRKNYENVKVYHIAKREFDHGHTRREGVKRSTAPFFVMMTQDAMPADEYMLEKLLEAFEDDTVAAAYARQLPRGDADPVERLSRNFNYPAESRIKTKADLPELGIKTFFCSNVCAAYRRSVYDELGGFVKRAIFNEDMIYAHSCIMAGYGIAYRAEAAVIHSHNYTNRQQFHRNFDLGVSQADNPQVFQSISSESEGVRYVKKMASSLKDEGNGKYVIPMCITSAYKLLGFRLGKNYRKLSHKQVLKYTMNKEFFRKIGY